jgi:plastocyanin
MRLLRPIALLAGTAAALPAIAASETSPTIEAVNKKGSGAYAEERHAWSPEQASVATGGAVKITNPSEVPHGVRWVSGPSTPTCSSGVPVAGATTAFATKWSGTCTFTQAGTYTFYCTVHGAEMTGRVVVSAAAAPPPAAQGSPLAGSESEAIRLSARQHGRTVHGSLALSAAAGGGRLEVELLAKAASLGASGHAQLSAGKLLRSPLMAGAVSFSVPLNTRARRALRRHRRLELSVRITLTSASGSVLTATRKVLMRP